MIIEMFRKSGRLLQTAVGVYRRGIARSNQHSPAFGVLFDIDGVLVRGTTLIPAAKEAFRLLLDKNGKFRAPVVFVTNAGNCVRQARAQQLSAILEVEIPQDQVILSHSPLRMFHRFHDKQVLVSGQGPIAEIAKNVGFQHIITIDMIREAFPQLDVVDHSRRPKHLPPPKMDFPQIEAVILFGEPVRWETNLQLIIDVILSDGKLASAPHVVPYPHIPVLACNMDLLWVTEATMPRFGHGTFLVCLENIFKKITGLELRYEALIGKPSIITYKYAECVLRQQAMKRGWTAPIQRLYAIGDNPMADIYGANLYNQHIQAACGDQVHAQVKGHKVMETLKEESVVLKYFKPEEELPLGAADWCKSILVCTGMYRRYNEMPSDPEESVVETVFHGHRDFCFDPSLVEPSWIVEDVKEAVELIYKEEGWV
ncbi:haloacid dehalogenase-like hydrolase domain-containing 5 isoform X1 [Protopterus annectens]|uniref:haloacid dehalogenase-like hydrolase domain-containing 5 isoform X1 n=1 Tax=Protopterus annectens TaxID=7888 RepID=UPI001CF934A9|nr:haloacid dehalogenase-like hydrolase domain-containing 5 isoform X1 [Protopterus annectens]